MNQGYQPTPPTKLNIYGFKLTVLQTVLLVLFWLFFITVIWPVIMMSYMFITPALCILCLLITGFINAILIIPLLLVFCASKKAVVVYQYFVMSMVTLILTWIYSWFIHMNFFVFFDHFAINMATVLLFYRLFTLAREDESNAS